jgi:cellulose biosynthesis protein BcsQ
MDAYDLSKEPTTPTKGRVICFTSAKGGSGKTVFAVSTAYSLLKAGKRVLCIDCDFSTRGLSLFLLSSLVDAPGLDIPREGCLAESLLDRLAVEKLQPLTISHGSIEFTAILSNRNLRQGGIPEDRLLGNTSDGGKSHIVDIPVKEYCNYFSDICSAMRDKFDYVIVDTRGGFDITTVVPAIVADYYCIVMEADEISMQQVFGLKSKIDEYGELLAQQVKLKGIIVNKALYSPTDKTYLEAVSRLYGGQPLGTVPIDRQAIRAYQKKHLALELVPESDFSFYSFGVINRIVGSEQSSWSATEKQNFATQAQIIRRKWWRRTQLDKIQTISPYITLVLFFLSVVCYWLSTKIDTDWAIKLLFGSIVSTILWCVAVLFITLFARWQQTDLFRTRGWFTIASLQAALYLFVGAAYLSIVAIPHRLSKDTLLTTIRAQRQTISNQQTELSASKARLKEAQEKLEVNEAAGPTSPPSTAAPPKWLLPVDKDVLESSTAAPRLSPSRIPPPILPGQLSTTPTNGRLPSAVLSLTGNDSSGRFGIVLSNDVDLEPAGPGAPSAAFEAQLAAQIGCNGVTMYHKEGYYQTVVPFDTERDALNALPQLSAWSGGRWKTAYLRPLDALCPRPIQKSSISPKGFDIPVNFCESSPNN